MREWGVSFLRICGWASGWTANFFENPHLLTVSTIALKLYQSRSICTMHKKINYYILLNWKLTPLNHVRWFAPTRTTQAEADTNQTEFHQEYTSWPVYINFKKPDVSNTSPRTSITKIKKRSRKNQLLFKIENFGAKIRSKRVEFIIFYIRERATIRHDLQAYINHIITKYRSPYSQNKLELYECASFRENIVIILP